MLYLLAGALYALSPNHGAIIGVYPLLYKGFNAWDSFGRIEPEDSVDFIRAIDHPLRTWIPRPAARFCELLGLGQVSLTPLQCLLCTLPIFNIVDESIPLDHIPGIIS